MRDYGSVRREPFGQHDFEGLKDKQAGDLKIPAGRGVTFVIASSSMKAMRNRRLPSVTPNTRRAPHKHQITPRPTASILHPYESPSLSPELLLTTACRQRLRGAGGGGARIHQRRRQSLAIAGANDDIRVAVIGLNGRGKNHLDGLSTVKGVRVVAICDADTAVMDRTAAYLFGETSSRAALSGLPETSPTKILRCRHPRHAR